MHSAELFQLQPSKSVDASSFLLGQSLHASQKIFFHHHVDNPIRPVRLSRACCNAADALTPSAEKASFGRGMCARSQRIHLVSAGFEMAAYAS